MQPTYMPWAGYFNLISQADVFIFLDDVQYEKSSWQNRNRVLCGGEVHWLTVPCRRESLSQTIDTIAVDDRSGWRQKHFKLLEQNYSRHPFGAEMMEAARAILDESRTLLAEINISLIRAFASKLTLSPRFARSSQLGISGQRSERLLKICEHFGCEEYLSPVGASEYLASDGVFGGARTQLLFQEYTPMAYAQCKREGFVSHLSLLDALANLGWGSAREYVRTGRALPVGNI